MEPQSPLTTVWDKLKNTWPAKLAHGLLQAAALPGDVYQGKVSMLDEYGRTNPEVIGRAADLAGVVMGGSYAAAPAMKDAAGMGIRAYHGSPHDFDKFDLSKIGTGEGAQAYGHGLYFAEKEGTARAYRDMLSSRPAINGSPIFDQKLNLVRSTGDEYLDNILKRSLGDVDLAKKDLARNIASEPVSDLPIWQKNHVEKISNSQRALETLRELEARGELKPVSPGRMYEVNINADPAHFLDWDKPLASQSATTKSALTNALDPKYGRGFTKEYSAAGNDFRDIVNNFDDMDPAQIARLLGSNGVPGVKYLDQGSRGAGQGSSNYVVFNDQIIDIMKKYAIPGLVSGGVLQQYAEENR